MEHERWAKSSMVSDCFQHQCVRAPVGCTREATVGSATPQTLVCGVACQARTADIIARTKASPVPLTICPKKATSVCINVHFLASVPNSPCEPMLQPGHHHPLHSRQEPTSPFHMSHRTFRRSHHLPRDQSRTPHQHQRPRTTPQQRLQTPPQQCSGTPPQQCWSRMPPQQRPGTPPQQCRLRRPPQQRHVASTATSPAKTPGRVASTATPPAKSLPDTSARSGFFRNFFLLSCRSHFTHLHQTISNSGGYQASSCSGNNQFFFLDSSDRFERHPVGSVVPPTFIGQTRRLINPLTTQQWVRVFIRSPPEARPRPARSLCRGRRKYRHQGQWVYWYYWSGGWPPPPPPPGSVVVSRLTSSRRLLRSGRPVPTIPATKRRKQCQSEGTGAKIKLPNSGLRPCLQSGGSPTWQRPRSLSDIGYSQITGGDPLSATYAYAYTWFNNDKSNQICHAYRV